MKTLTLASDNELVQSFEQGDNTALEMLVIRHQDTIFSCINILIKDALLAEDLFQHVFIKIIDTIREKNYNEEKFLPWALRIAHNVCVDHFAKVKPMPRITTGNDRDILEVINVSGDRDERAGKKNQSCGVRQILDLLPAEQREVIVFRHYADLSFKDIAAMFNCSINTVVRRMQYGLLNVRRMMFEKQVAL